MRSTGVRAVLVAFVVGVAVQMVPSPASATLRESLSGLRQTDEEKARKAQEAREEMRRISAETLRQLYAARPAARAVVERSAGHAVFSNFGLKLLVTGSAKGRGLAVDANGTEIFMRMAEIKAGLGFGVEKFRQVFVFDTPAAYRNFVDKGFELGGQAQVTAKSEDRGASHGGAISVSPGVWVFQLSDKGVVAELTVSGTKYYRDRDLD